MDLAKVSTGERIAVASAILLFVLMFFDWFEVKTVSTSNLLSYFQSFDPGRNAWEALDYIPIVLVAPVLATPTVAMLRAMGVVGRPAVAFDAAVALLGLGSALLILFRIIDPPVFSVGPTLMSEGVVQFPIFLALSAATGIFVGGCLAMREEGVSSIGLRRPRPRVAAVVLTVLVAVGIGGAGLTSASQAKTSKRPGASPSMPLAPALATGAFGLDLMRAQAPGNLVLSPDSVAAALALTGTGGVGNTAREIAHTLHLKDPTELPTVGDLQRAIATEQAAVAGDDPEAPTLEIANGLFLQRGLPFQPAFLSGARQRFGAAPEIVDFEGNRTGALEAINGWVSERTKGLIPKILDSLPDGMALALANAIYLDAKWKHPFKRRETRPGVFNAPLGKVTIDFMHQTESLRYGAGPGYKAVALPYRSSSLSLLVMLPVGQRVGSLQNRLDARSLGRIARTLSSKPVILSLPRFHLHTDVELTETLKKLGMRTAFTEAANFSRITTAAPLEVAFVKHAADFTVDEAGTVAAAATVVGVVKTSASVRPRDAVVFNANRPFLFFLRDDPTGAVLFAGRLVSPSEID
jgi:serpin B